MHKNVIMQLAGSMEMITGVLADWKLQGCLAVVQC